MTDPVQLIHGDCVEVMATLSADSVDAVVTDPPYGLEFMGKEWDRFDRNGPASFEHSMQPGWGHGTTPLPRMGTMGQKAVRAFQAWCEQWGREALRVTKPGGYLLSFGGTRTHHRLVCALEDAGWIIRDELDWIYASGFPKGKANLKPAHEPIVLARKPGPLRPLAIDECRIPSNGDKGVWPITERDTASGLYTPPPVETDNTVGRWPSNVLLSDPELFDEPNPYVVGSGAEAGSVNQFFGQSGHRRGGDGDGVTLGLSGTKNAPDSYGDSGGYSRFFIVPKADRAERERGLVGTDERRVYGQGKGVKTRECRQCGDRTQSDGPPYQPACGHDDWEWKDALPLARANVHPTVKPIDLMRHLVRLVTPVGGLVLDPFLGSGTTALAASEEGFRCIGIEKEAEYLEIARGRLISTPLGFSM